MTNKPKDNANKIVQELTDLLLDNDCTINRPAMLKLAIYILEREKTVINEQYKIINLRRRR